MIILENVELLANAIVEQAAEDYKDIFLGYQLDAKHSIEDSKRELEAFFCSHWYNELTKIDSGWLMHKIRLTELEKLLDFYEKFLTTLYMKTIVLKVYEKEPEKKSLQLLKWKSHPGLQMI